MSDQDKEEEAFFNENPPQDEDEANDGDDEIPAAQGQEEEQQQEPTTTQQQAADEGQPADEVTRQPPPEEEQVTKGGNDAASDTSADAQFFTEQRRGSKDSSQGSSKSGSKEKNRRSFDAALSTSFDGHATRRDTPLPLRFVISKIALYIDSSELGTQLMIFVPFLICFVFFFLAGRSVEENFFVIKSIRDRMMTTEFPNVAWQINEFRTQVLNEQRLFVELDKNFEGIGNSGDWADWLADVAVTTTWDCRHPNARHELLAPTGQAYHLGAMRVRTQRMPANSCEVRDRIYPTNASNFPQACYGQHKKEKEQKGQHCNHSHPITGEPMFVYKEHADVPGGYVPAIEGVYHTGGFMFEIPFSYSCNEALEMADIAGGGTTDCPFTDNWATRFVIVEYFVYSPQTDTFHAIKMFTEILPGGWWYNQFLFRSFQLFTTRPAFVVLDILVICFVIFYWIYFFYELRTHYKETGKILGFFFEFWNILELVNLTTFVVMFGIRWTWINASNQASEVLQFPYKPEYPPHLDKIMILYNSQVYCNSVNTILTFLKLLKYVRLNERLNVLTRTIALCQQSIVGVLVLFVFVVLGYGITAWTLFGINIEGFRNLGVSMSSLLRILVGEMDYEALRNENRFLAGAFFWSYVILALFLLLNFLIAIISEAFAKVSGKAYSQDFDEIVLRWWQQARAVMAGHNIKRQIGNFFAFKSEVTMLRIVLASLREKLEEEEAQELAERQARNAERRQMSDDPDFLVDLEDTDDIVINMYRHHWKEWLDEDTYSTLTQYYFDYTWEDLLNDFDDARKSSEEVDKRHMFETVQAGVEKVVGEEMEKVDKLDAMLTQLETETTKLIAALGPNS